MYKPSTFFAICLFLLSFESPLITALASHKLIEYRIHSDVASITKIPYNLRLPDKTLELPSILNEVSGLTDIDSTYVACVQDEMGTVFIYDFHSGAIMHKHTFDTTGDFEGLTFTGNSLFILRSDGRLTEWQNFNPKSGGGTLSHTTLTLMTANNEGLCYDNRYNRLLIAAKSKPINHDSKAERFIYEYSLSINQLNPIPAYSINTMELEIAARKFGIERKDTAVKSKVKPFNFRPSSLAVHPYTSDIYIISAADQLLLIMNREGTIIHMEELSSALFAKAEGITFLNDGTMIITNEAAGKVPTLLIFKSKN